MKPPRFNYYAPDNLPEAVRLLSTLDNARLLAGGQSLVPMLNMRYALPDHLIDLNRIPDLSYIRRNGRTLEIGAMTRQREIEFSAEVARECPLLIEAIHQVGHRQTRNRGTIGGSLCHLDPSAELVTVAAALDATITILGPRGERRIPFSDFPAGYMTTSVQPDECLTAISLPLWSPSHGHAFVEFARRHGDFALVSAAALLEENASGTIERASVTLGGVAATPLRMTEVEQALVGRPAGSDLFQDACAVCAKIEALEDVHAPSSYRQHLAVVMARRALEKAHARARERSGRRDA
ncbi:MAG TPA: xanthine dehydrogenase family protein subunit M [Xanthobacteraceae bacterium]|nr:xanthine dehydrogenase family protein subunit M [Xanthobacteraceae bacterium]